MALPTLSPEVTKTLERVIEQFRNNPNSALVGLALSNDPVIKDRYQINVDAVLYELTQLVLAEIRAAPKKDFALRYNHGKPKWSLVHFASLEPMVRVLEFGAKQYAPDNWKKGFPDRDLMECMQRHLAAMLDGEENDPETGLPHQAHIMCNCMFLSYQQLNRKDNGATNKGGDDVRGDGGDERADAAPDK